MGRMDGQVAWVSGGASGMGEATAELFASEGARVAVTDVQEARGREVAHRIREQGGEAIFLGATLHGKSRCGSPSRRRWRISTVCRRLSTARESCMLRACTHIPGGTGIV